MKTPRKSLAADVFFSYAELIKKLLPAAEAVGFFDAQGQCRWSSSPTRSEQLKLMAQKCLGLSPPVAIARSLQGACLLVALPVRHEAHVVGTLSVCVAVAAGEAPDSLLSATKRVLQPLLNVLANEFRHSTPSPKAAVLTERTQELEWLFAVTADLRASSNESNAVEQLLAAAVERMEAAFGGIALPEKRINVTYASRVRVDARAAIAYQSTHPRLMSYVQRRQRPLLINHPPADRPDLAACKILAVPIEPQHGKIAGFIAFFKSISQPDFARRQVYLGRHIARQISAMLDGQYDLATGLYNRSAMEKQAAQLIESRRADEPHSLIYIDIDRLHVVNETLGFDIGDEAIVRIADLLHPPHVPSDALAARIAGDRFVVLLPAHDAAQARERATALQGEAVRITFGQDEQRIALSLSCGVAHLSAGAGSFARSMAAAEIACKTAKDRGRNRTEVYLEVDESMIRRRSDISGLARLREALDANRLQMYAQRIVPVDDRTRPSGVECLVRLMEKDGTILSPAAFMSAAQRYQLLRQIDELVIRNTLQALTPFASLLFHSGMYASINISGQSLGDEAFLQRVEQWVRESQVAPGLITFEITETAAVSNLARTDKLMRGLRQLGCRFALDDFGTGVNSLSYLKSLQVDRVKIDGSFIKDIVTNPRSEAMVRAVVQLAAGLDIDCVAEFVETDDIMRRIRTLGVGYAQGYLIHKPEPLKDVLNRLAIDESRRIQRLSLTG